MQTDCSIEFGTSRLCRHKTRLYGNFFPVFLSQIIVSTRAKIVESKMSIMPAYSSVTNGQNRCARIRKFVIQCGIGRSPNGLAILRMSSCLNGTLKVPKTGAPFCIILSGVSENNLVYTINSILWSPISINYKDCLNKCYRYLSSSSLAPSRRLSQSPKSISL